MFSLLKKLNKSFERFIYGFIPQSFGNKDREEFDDEIEFQEHKQMLRNTREKISKNIFIKILFFFILLFVSAIAAFFVFAIFFYLFLL